MLRKDVRSMLLSLVIGDGCLFEAKRFRKQGNVKLYGGLTIHHGIKQADYLSWKSKLISKLTNRNVKLRSGHKGTSVQLSVSMKRFRSWRKFCYPNNNKDISKILKFINNPEFTIAIWLMDDGYVESSITKNKNYSAAFRIFCCDQNDESLSKIMMWLKDTLNVDSKIRFQKKGDKRYPFIKINSKDSLHIWKIIREFVLQFKSMQYKFRYIEQIYQQRML